MLKIGDSVLVKYGNVQLFGKVHKFRYELIDVNITTTTKKTCVWVRFPWEVYKLIAICS
jgi:hypothetical protein